MKKLYQFLNKISDVICIALSILLVIIVSLNAGSVFLQVINRYIIVKISDLSFPWTEEMARYSMIWVCYLAIPLCYREGAMAQLDMIFDRLNHSGKMVLYIMTRLICFAVIYCGVHYGFQILQLKMYYRSSMLRAPGYMLYSAPIVGCVLLAFEIITELVGVFSGELQPFYAGEKRKIHFLDKGDS